MDIPVTAALAAHRFGLGEASLGTIGEDPAGWLLAQIGPAEPAVGEALATAAQALARLAEGTPAQREAVRADALSRLETAVQARRPFAERLQWFWANHFTVSLLKGSTHGLVGPFEREAIRPHIAGRFEALLWSATTHPAMLRYLDNHLSAGPHSHTVAAAARRAERMGEGPRVTGLNENLARELLELHTLGADSLRGAPPAYTQADVTALAAVLTGWRVGNRGGDAGQPFEPAWHEPGAKRVLGRTRPEGPEGLRSVVTDLARHPATARFVCTKLARHFVADEPAPALVAQLTEAWRRSDGELPEVYRALVASPLAWEPAPAKLKTPEEFVVSAARVLGGGGREPRGLPLAAGIAALGQRIQAAPSPAGWPDRAEEWLGPDAVWKRVEWSNRIGERFGRFVDARGVAEASLGPLLGDESRRQIARAADGAQALALLLMAPEFQRR